MSHSRLFVLFLLVSLPSLAERITISLDGNWKIADSVAADEAPGEFSHTVPVPGLAHLATPPFADVDRFDSAAIVANRISKGMLPESARVTGAGVSRQKRNYFWYRTSFRAPEHRDVVILKVNKAQFGTAVWLNGEPVGEHLGCFTAGYFDLTGAIHWDRDNQLTIRIGAHPGVLPREIPAGDDFEKNYWTPGIYDSVSVRFIDNPVIETVQVAPRIQTSEALVQTTLHNYGEETDVTLTHTLRTWKGREQVTTTAPTTLSLPAGGTKTIVQVIPIPRAHLWSPDDPFLYVLESRTSADNVETRFGMREFRFDTATRRAWLNGKVYFLRGSNITLHRFFEDPKSGALPWNEAWVRKLLVEIPKKMNWNYFRFCIGPVPERWLEIADEAGLLIQNEFFIWTGAPNWHGGFRRPWDAKTLIGQYTEWMRDNWNHPSVAVWDANNETLDPVFAAKVIPAVRDLDLSNRPWENSYNLPAGPDDPVEDHPYLFSRNRRDDGNDFKMTMLERMSSRGSAGHTPSGHANILNEYGWLWLNRDGSPTVLTKRVYEKLLGPDATAEQRFRLYGYYLGGLTEFWRAHRRYAGVIHFVYLTASDSEGYTSDNFRDIKTLELDPYFADYVGEAFKPVGVYINFWGEKLEGGAERDFVVMIANDKPERVFGKLSLAIESRAGQELLRQEQPLDLAPLGQRTYRFVVKIPQTSGEVELRATAMQTNVETTVSRRHSRIE